MKRHIFLTGDIQVGKSTIIQRYLEAHPDLRVGGFRTVWKDERWNNRNTLYIVPAVGPDELTDSNCVGLREGVFPDRIATDYPEVFNTNGAALLEEPEKYDLMLMDEIGIGENTAEGFQKAVLSVLDVDTPVMGVVRDKPGVLTDAVRNHPNVQTVVVTVENRENVLKELLGMNESVRYPSLSSGA